LAGSPIFGPPRKRDGGNQAELITCVAASATAAGSNTATWPLPFAYGKQHHQLIVGRPADNVATIVTLDEIFKGGFD